MRNAARETHVFGRRSGARPQINWRTTPLAHVSAWRDNIAIRTVSPEITGMLRGSVISTQQSTKSFGRIDLCVDIRWSTKWHDQFVIESLIGGVWSSREFTAIGQDPRVIFPPLNIPIEWKDGTWRLFWNFDPFLVVDPCDPNRGWGVFGRTRLSNGNPNPIEWNLSLGIGGSSPISGRDYDTFGAGWHYLGLSNEIGAIGNLLLQPRDETGIEL